MTDIRIIKGRDKAYIFAETLKARVWLRRNMSEYNVESEYTCVALEGIEEVIELMRKDELSVETGL